MKEATENFTNWQSSDIYAILKLIFKNKISEVQSRPYTQQTQYLYGITTSRSTRFQKIVSRLLDRRRHNERISYSQGKEVPRSRHRFKNPIFEIITTHFWQGIAI